MKMLLGRDRTGVQHFYDWDTDGHLHLSYEYSSVISYPWLGRIAWFAADAGMTVMLGGSYSRNIRSHVKNWGTPRQNMLLSPRAEMSLTRAEKSATSRIHAIRKKGAWEGSHILLVLDNAELLDEDEMDRVSTLMRVGADLGISVVTAVDEAVGKIRHEAPVNTLQLGYMARGPYSIERAPNQNSAVMTTSQGVRKSFVFDHDTRAASL